MWIGERDEVEKGIEEKWQRKKNFNSSLFKQKRVEKKMKNDRKGFYNC